MVECAPGCDGNWYDCAKEILDRSGLTVEYFSEVVRELLIKGRGKYRNLMLTGPANCGKTFLLNPLTFIFNTFCNPASCTYNNNGFITHFNSVYTKLQCVYK